MEENKNIPAEANAAEEQPKKAKLTGDNRTFLVSLLTSVIVVIAYHMTMELIKFFNEDEFNTMGYQQVQIQHGSAMGHHHGPRPMMKKKWQFRHFKDCKYFNEADCDQKPMKDCKCMDRYKEIRAKRRAEFRKKHQIPSAEAAAPKAPAAPADKK